MPQNQIVLCETSLDLLQHMHHHKFQQSYNKHTQTTMEGNGLERKEIPLMFQYMYESLGSVGHIMVGKPTQLSTNTTIIEVTIAEPLWSML